MFNDIIKNLENNQEFKKTIMGILFDGLRLLFIRSDSVINLGVMFGILAEKDKEVAIANIIFETFLYNHIIAGKIQSQYSFGLEKNQFIENGQLDTEKVLQKFQELMKDMKSLYEYNRSSKYYGKSDNT